MSQWMSIGFDPDHMDPLTEPKTQTAISGGRDGAAPQQTGDVGQATPRELGAGRGLNDSSKH
jgi:hypothetical protein